MRKSTRLPAVMVLVLAVFPFQHADGQESETSNRSEVEQLKKELEELRERMESLQQRIETMEKRETPEPEGVSSDDSDDLMDIEPLSPDESDDRDAASEDQDELTVEPVENAPPVAGNVFNPKIALVGNIIGSAGDDDPLFERDSIALEEAELSFQAWIDPYAQANVFIGFSEEEGASVEEGYAEFVHLPWDLVARVGKMKGAFGKFNQEHFHAWSWIDAPLVSSEFFGDEGIADAGISVSRIIPVPGEMFVEATAEVYRGDVEDVFEADSRSDLAWIGRLRAFRELTENSNLDLGWSYATGGLPGGEGRNEFGGFDATWRWKPVRRSLYRSFIGRLEVMANDRSDTDETALGWYASGDYQFARRWSGGLRLDSSRRPDSGARDRGQSLLMTFRPSEFSLVRGQLRRFDYAGLDDGLELLLQLQFSIGSHGAHSF